MISTRVGQQELFKKMGVDGQASAALPLKGLLRGECTYYSILGVDIDAPQETIRSRYLQLAKVHHPDRIAPGSNDELRDAAKRKFQDILSAFEVLNDEERRHWYDLDLLEQLNVESYLQRFQGLILTACGLGMAFKSSLAVEEGHHQHQQNHSNSSVTQMLRAAAS